MHLHIHIHVCTYRQAHCTYTHYIYTCITYHHTYMHVRGPVTSVLCVLIPGILDDRRILNVLLLKVVPDEVAPASSYKCSYIWLCTQNALSTDHTGHIHICIHYSIWWLEAQPLLEGRLAGAKRTLEPHLNLLLVLIELLQYCLYDFRVY